MAKEKCPKCGELYNENENHVCGSLGGSGDITKHDSKDTGPGAGGLD